LALAGALRGPVRDQHGRLLDPESPEDLQQMAVTWHKQRLGEAAGGHHARSTWMPRLPALWPSRRRAAAKACAHGMAAELGLSA